MGWERDSQGHVEKEECFFRPGFMGPSSRQVCRGEIISFLQGLDIQGWVSGLLQNSRARVCLAKLVYAPLMCQEPGKLSGGDSIS